MTVRFRVDEVFDLSSRAGLLVCGTILEGDPIGIPAFSDGVTGQALNLIGVEFPTSRTARHGQITYVLDRAHATSATASHEWIAETSP